MTTTAPKLRAHDIRRIAVEAIVDERTVRAFLKDAQRVRSTSAARITAAIRALGLSAAEKGVGHG
jgi:DNA-binding LacI/PurR family transcriptional regulator